MIQLQETSNVRWQNRAPKMIHRAFPMVVGCLVWTPILLWFHYSPFFSQKHQEKWPKLLPFPEAPAYFYFSDSTIVRFWLLLLRLLLPRRAETNAVQDEGYANIRKIGLGEVGISEWRWKITKEEPLDYTNILAFQTQCWYGELKFLP